MDILTLFNYIEINLLLSLKENYDIVINKFTENGFKIYQPEYLNDMVCSKDFALIFNIFQNENKNTFFVINSPWDKEKINLILNSFSQPSEKSKVYFISAYPLPDILRFIQKNNQTSFFELESIRHLKNMDNLFEDISLIENYYNSCLVLVKKYFEIDLDLSIPNSIKVLEKIIINKFRNGEEYDTIYDTDIDYFPHYSLLLLGFYLSYVLIKNFDGEVFYNKTQDIKEFGVGFSANKNDVIDILSNPINKVFNFYLYGKDSSIINWVYEIKYYLKNPDKITNQENK